MACETCIDDEVIEAQEFAIKELEEYYEFKKISCLVEEI